MSDNGQTKKNSVNGNDDCYRVEWCLISVVKVTLVKTCAFFKRTKGFRVGILKLYNHEKIKLHN